MTHSDTKTRRSLAALGLAMALTGCVAGDVTGVERSTLMNGEEGGLPGVGMLRGRGTCTATLIRPDTVLTAAHCLRAPMADGAAALEAVSYPIELYLRGEVYLSYAASIHPTYDTNEGRDLSVAADIPGDIAVVHFEELVDDVSYPLATEPPQPGDRITLLGYGLEGPDSTDFGTERIGFARVDRVTDQNIIMLGPRHERAESPELAGVCPGDSGGPSFLATEAGDTLVGVHSTDGPYHSNDCGMESWDIRVDTYRSWVEESIEKHATDPDDGQENGAWGWDEPEAAAAGCSVATGGGADPRLSPLLLLVLILR